MRLIPIILALAGIMALPCSGLAEILSYAENNCSIAYNGGEVVCTRGEYAAVDQAVVGPGRYADTDKPGCANRPASFNDLQQAVVGLAAAYNTANIALGLHTVLNNETISRKLEGVIGGHNLNELMNFMGQQGVVNAANCHTLATIIPKDATVTGQAILATNPDGVWLKCRTGWADKCGKCWQAFPEPVTTKVVGDSKVSRVVYRNWKHDMSRRAKLVTFYTLPRNVTQAPLR